MIIDTYMLELALWVFFIEFKGKKGEKFMDDPSFSNSDSDLDFKNKNKKIKDVYSFEIN